MKILIATPLFPPDVGGPAKYAQGIATELGVLGHSTPVVAYSRLEKSLPVGLRHFVYFVRLLPRLAGADAVFALDAASVGVPAYLAARLGRKKFLIRLGGDFLWEQYVERTKQSITLREFNEHMPALTFKERVTFALCRFALRGADKVLFNTPWFEDIAVRSYGIDPSHTAIVRNELPERHESVAPKEKNFLFAGRQIALKNADRLHEAFAKAKKRYPSIVLTEGMFSPADLKEKLRTCYAIIQPSVSDVAPNLILEGLSYGKPFVLTTETGLKDEYKDLGLWVNPLSVDDIAEKICLMADDDTYQHYASRARLFSEVRTFADIARDVLALV
jgi:glycosyltransferase involved in cell wall biosynthesis